MGLGSLFKWGGGGHKPYDVNVNAIPAGNYTMNGQPYDPSAYNASERARLARVNADMARQRNLVRVGQLATLAGFGAAALPAAAGGAGGAAAGGTAIGAQTGVAGAGFGGAAISTAAPVGMSAVAPAVAGGMKMGTLMEMGKLGAGLYGTVAGNRTANRANTLSQQQQEREFQAQMAFAQQQEATRKAEADRLAVESRTQWDAQQKFQADQFKASEEERLYNLRLRQEAEARKAPRRAASEAARMRLSDFLGLGRS